MAYKRIQKCTAAGCENKAEDSWTAARRIRAFAWTTSAHFQPGKNYLRLLVMKKNLSTDERAGQQVE